VGVRIRPRKRHGGWVLDLENFRLLLIVYSFIAMFGHVGSC